MIVRDAPIIPGAEAAGIRIGACADDVVRAATHPFVVEDEINTCVQAPTGVVRYRSPSVDFWATDGIVDQVMVHDDYRGTALGGLALHTTLAETEGETGLWVRDGDRFRARDLPGVSVALDAVHDQLTAWRHAPITAIYVYKP